MITAASFFRGTRKKI